MRNYLNSEFGMRNSELSEYANLSRNRIRRDVFPVPLPQKNKTYSFGISLMYNCIYISISY